MSARNWWLAGLLALLVLALGALAWLRQSDYGAQAHVATGYAARVVCSCRYLGGRDMASCKTDFEPGMEVVGVEDDPAARRVTAWVPLFAKRSARFTPGYGCDFEPGN